MTSVTGNTTLTPARDVDVPSQPDQKISLELIWTVCAFAFWSPHIFRALFRKNWTLSRRSSRALLSLHIFGSLLEVVIFHSKLWQLGHDPLPTQIDLFLCLVGFGSNLYMATRVRHLPNTMEPLARVAFQAMAFQRLLASGMAWYHGSAAWHRASAKILHNFIWARVGIVWGRRFLAGFESYGAAYTGGTVACTLFGMYEGSYPHGALIWAGIMISLLVFDRWAQKFDKYESESLEDMEHALTEVVPLWRL